MYLDLSPLLVLGYAVLAPLLILSTAWFFVGGTADRVVDAATDLIMLTLRPAAGTAVRRAGWLLGGLLIALGRHVGGSDRMTGRETYRAA